MPNHVSNHVQIKSLDDDWKKEEDAFAKLQEVMKTDDHPFDFNVLIPYPEQYRILDDARDAADKVPGVKWSDLPEDGYNNGGYRWCCDNWGTKWNAYSIGFDYDSVYFKTAWATPLPIWAELSKRFPELRVEVEYADEDLGNNCGRLAYMNGKQVLKEDMSDRPDSKLFARAIIAECEAADNKAKYQALMEERAKRDASAELD